MAIDAATRDSLELTRSVGGATAGSLLGEIDRCQTAAWATTSVRGHLGAADRSGCDRAATCTGRWFNEEAIRRERVRNALKALPDFPRAWRGWQQGVEARATWRSCAMDSPAPRR